MSAPQQSVYYSLAHGVDAVPLADGNLLFRSDTLAVRIEGGFARVLRERVLPLLDGSRSFADVAAALSDLPSASLSERLETLVESQVLRRADAPQGDLAPDTQALEPFLTLLDAFGMPAAQAIGRLGQARVAIAGLEGHGAHLAAILARCGVGNLLLLDPFPCEPGNLGLVPLLGPDAVGAPRQDALRSALQRLGGPTRIETGGNEPLSRERVAALAQGSHLLVGCFDRGFSSADHWLNRAALAHGIPALFAESRADTALVGPLVLPGQTACYMCYRMRGIACEDDFEAAMSYEEFLDRRKQPALHARGVLPTIPPYIGSLLALETLRLLLGLGPSPLAGTVLEFGALTLKTETHSVLGKPDCPVCSEKKNRQRPHPLIAEERASDAPPGNLLDAAPRLLSRRTGVLRRLIPITPDAGEPTRPLVLGVEIANGRFLQNEPREQRTCSGKGLTMEAARISAFGEGVERYSGTCWDHTEITYGRAADLPDEHLDPRALVLYAPDQYEHLPYKPYTGDNVLGWVPARSLVTGRRPFVPALAVYLNYEVRSPDEYLFPITSNGMATGATLLDAILAAAGEVFERDAFMAMWFHRLPCRRVDPGTLPDADIRALCEAYRRRGVEMRLYRLPTDHPCHVFASVAVQVGPGDGPAIVVGLGADLTAHRAARKAILEIGQVRPSLRKRMREEKTRQRLDELVADPHRVATLDDHDLLYASPKALGAMAFLLDRPLEDFAWDDDAPEHAADRLQLLVDHCRTQNWDLVYHNLTPPDMAAFGLHTVHAILPDFQPIHFGWKEPRLGGERLTDLPRRLGLRPDRATRSDLNDDPHPLA